MTSFLTDLEDGRRRQAVMMSGHRTGQWPLRPGLIARQPSVAFGEIVRLLRKWADEHDGLAPLRREWHKATTEWPSAGQVDYWTWRARAAAAQERDGWWTGESDWAYALAAAGLAVRTSGDHQATRSRRHEHGRNRQMVTGRGFDERIPGSIKHSKETS